MSRDKPLQPRKISDKKSHSSLKTQTADVFQYQSRHDTPTARRLWSHSFRCPLLCLTHSWGSHSTFKCQILQKIPLCFKNSVSSPSLRLLATFLACAVPSGYIVKARDQELRSLRENVLHLSSGSGLPCSEYVLVLCITCRFHLFSHERKLCPWNLNYTVA